VNIDVSSPDVRSSLELSCSRNFTSWLGHQNISIAFTTYQAGKLFLIGRKADSRLSGFERTFRRCMGMWSDGQTIWLSSLYQLWRLENTLLPGQLDGEFDRLYVPQVGYTTGDVDIHDVAVDTNGAAVFVNTLFSCLATCSVRYSFTPLWRPPFISKLAPEDRCHLNGLAMQDGRPRYVTACATSDVVDGWRHQRVRGGVVVDTDTGEVVCDRLSMPHSPRLIDGQLWLLESGTGYLGRVDFAAGKFEPVTFCPGYARGLAVTGNYALVGTSKCRQERTFSDLQLEKNLAQRQGEATCGVLVVDLSIGDIVHWLRVDGIVEELYDVAVLPSTRRPKALGFKTDEIQHVVWLEAGGRTERFVAEAKSLQDE
jgi:uncharacterized protein (TIGR03032 family)